MVILYCQPIHYKFGYKIPHQNLYDSGEVNISEIFFNICNFNLVYSFAKLKEFVPTFILLPILLQTI